MRVAVVHGGFSSEAVYSTENAECVHEALLKKGYDSYMQDYDENIVENLKKRKPDAVFLCVQGMHHGDGTLQGILDLLKIPYTGSRMEYAAVINDKVFCQSIFDMEGFPVAKHFSFRLDEYESPDGPAILEKRMEEHNMRYPIVSKSPSQGACIGIHYIRSAEQYDRISQSFLGDEQILIEDFVEGIGFTAPLVQDGKKWLALPLIYGRKIDISNGTKTGFDISHKQDLVHFSPETTKRIQDTAIRAAKVIGARGYCRVDFMMDPKEDKETLLEINAVPGLRKGSLFPVAAEAAGIAFEDLIEMILLNCLDQKEDTHAQ
ncbi:MAG: ATP-grasp domain-containing protein [Lachnospiraceae bacterium]|nr:ATP-grasp domain-containing protein [Lachnospiraceae bacterium]